MMFHINVQISGILEEFRAFGIAGRKLPLWVQAHALLGTMVLVYLPPAQPASGHP